MVAIDKLVQALAPAFAAGFAVQQALEILGQLFAKLADVAKKKAILGVVSLGLGVLFAWPGHISVLAVLSDGTARWVDVLVTALVISAGTEGVNSVMKFLGYKKEEQKAQAAKVRGDAPPEGMMKMNLV